MRTKIFMSCRSRSYEASMNRFQKDLDLVLTVMSEAESAESLLEPKTLAKAKETFNYPEWVDFKKPDMPKAWRARPSFMRGVEVSKEKSVASTAKSVKATGESSTEKVVTLKNGKQISGKVAAEGDNYIVSTDDGDIKVPKGKVFSVEGKKSYDHLTGKNRATLSTIVLPLEHGWTEKEILLAMWDSIVNKAVEYKSRSKWDKGLTFEDAIQVAGLALLDAIRTDVGGVPFSVHAATHMNKYLARRAEKEREIKKKEISYDQPAKGAEGEEKSSMIDLMAGTGVDEIIKQGLWDQVWALFEKSRLSNLERDVAVRLLGMGVDSGEHWTPLDRVILKPRRPGTEPEEVEGRHIRSGGTAARPTVTLRMADGKEKTILKSDIESINPQLPGSAPPLIRIILQDGGEILGRKLGIETKVVRDASGKAVGEKKILSVRTMDGEEKKVSKDDIQKNPDGSLAVTQPPGEVKGQWYNAEAHRRTVGYPSEPKPMREVEIAKELGISEGTVKSAKKSIRQKFADALKIIGYQSGEKVVGKVEMPAESVEPKISLGEWKRQMGLPIL